MTIAELARQSGVQVAEVNETRARQNFERFAREYFGASAEEFERRYEAGEFDGVDTPALHRVLAVRDLLR